MQNFTIEHRAPRKGEKYIGTGTLGGTVIKEAPEDATTSRDVLVPVAPAWPDKPVIVIDEGTRREGDLVSHIRTPVIAVRDEKGVYWTPAVDCWVQGRDVIEAWHEYVPDGYAQVLRVTAGELAATSVTTSRLVAPRREYTADDLDNLPAGGCFWDEGDYVWQKIEGVWKAPDRPIDGNPLMTGTVTHAYSAPEEPQP